MREVWKDIPGYEGYYQVSNLGNVKSLNRYIRHWQGGESIKRGQAMSQSTHPEGYKRLKLLKLGKTTTWTVHRLVAIAFLGYKPKGDLIVHHINNNPSDNRLSNLKVVTYRENAFTHHKGSSKYKGVCWHKQNKNWTARIRVNGLYKHLGSFMSEIEASEAYQNAFRNLR